MRHKRSRADDCDARAVCSIQTSQLLLLLLLCNQEDFIFPQQTIVIHLSFNLSLLGCLFSFRHRLMFAVKIVFSFLFYFAGASSLQCKILLLPEKMGSISIKRFAFWENEPIIRRDVLAVVCAVALPNYPPVFFFFFSQPYWFFPQKEYNHEQDLFFKCFRCLKIQETWPSSPCNTLRVMDWLENVKSFLETPISKCFSSSSLICEEKMFIFSNLRAIMETLAGRFIISLPSCLIM